MRIVMLFRKSPDFALVLFLILISGALSVTPAQQKKSIILATTTSTEDSGLLDVLIPVFERSSGYIVKTISVGSGPALKMGEGRGRRPALTRCRKKTRRARLCHQSQGSDAQRFRHRRPSADPAGIRNSDPPRAFSSIARRRRSLFAQRQFDTHA